jgi:hypothetical protein
LTLAAQNWEMQVDILIGLAESFSDLFREVFLVRCTQVQVEKGNEAIPGVSACYL